MPGVEDLLQYCHWVIDSQEKVKYGGLFYKNRAGANRVRGVGWVWWGGWGERGRGGVKESVVMGELKKTYYRVRLE